MTTKLLLLVAALALTAVGVQPSAASAQTLRSRLLLIVAGQSNATGGCSLDIDPITDIDYLAPPYTNGADAHDTITWEPWSMASPPSTRPVPLDTPQIPNPDIGLCGGTGARFGPEIGLARQVYADTGQAATIVKAAMPGTSITEWAPKAAEQLLPIMVKEVRSAIASDRRHGFVDTIGGFYWYQGEADGAYVPWADLYQGNLSRLIQNVRKDLPLGKAPVGIVEATEAGSWIPPGMQIVRTADAWAATHLAKVVTVDSKGLPRFDNGPHLTNTSELTIGEELAKATDHRKGF